jgi:hypothetical protein
MRRLVLVLIAAAFFGIAGAPAAQAAATTKIVTVVSRGITGIALSNNTIDGGPGSANAFVGNFSATTVPAELPVTWAITGGNDAARFVVTPAGALSAGPADLAPRVYTFIITATTAAMARVNRRHAAPTARVDRRR